MRHTTFGWLLRLSAHSSRHAASARSSESGPSIVPHRTHADCPATRRRWRCSRASRMATTGSSTGKHTSRTGSRRMTSTRCIGRPRFPCRVGLKPTLRGACRSQPRLAASASAIWRANAAGSRGGSPSCTRARSSRVPATSSSWRVRRDGGSACGAGSPPAPATCRHPPGRPASATAASAGPARRRRRPAPRGCPPTGPSPARRTRPPSAVPSMPPRVASRPPALPPRPLTAASTDPPRPASRNESASPRRWTSAPARTRPPGPPSAAPRHRGRGTPPIAGTSPARPYRRRPGRRWPPAPASCAPRTRAVRSSPPAPRT